MNWGLQGLLFSLICALATGFILPSDLFGILELLGIVALIACIVLPIPSEQNLLSRLRTVLFSGGMGLLFFSTFLKTPVTLSVFTTWIAVISLYTTLSGAFLGLSGTLSRVQLSFILYSVCLLGICLGHLGHVYFFESN
jgi:hypothetical protein